MSRLLTGFVDSMSILLGEAEHKLRQAAKAPAPGKSRKIEEVWADDHGSRRTAKRIRRRAASQFFLGDPHASGRQWRMLRKALRKGGHPV